MSAQHLLSVPRPPVEPPGAGARPGDCLGVEVREPRARGTAAGERETGVSELSPGRRGAAARAHARCQPGALRGVGPLPGGRPPSSRFDVAPASGLSAARDSDAAHAPRQAGRGRGPAGPGGRRPWAPAAARAPRSSAVLLPGGPGWEPAMPAGVGTGCLWSPTAASGSCDAASLLVPREEVRVPGSFYLRRRQIVRGLRAQGNVEALESENGCTFYLFFSSLRVEWGRQLNFQPRDASCRWERPARVGGWRPGAGAREPSGAEHPSRPSRLPHRRPDVVTQKAARGRREGRQRHLEHLGQGLSPSGLIRTELSAGLRAAGADAGSAEAGLLLAASLAGVGGGG